MASQRKTSGRPPANHGLPKTPGAWIPWPLVEVLVRLHLRPASQSRVFLAILCTSCRYDMGDAKLTERKLAEMTKLKVRTVQAALRGLIGRGLVSRIGRFGVLRVNVLPAGSGVGGADTSAPPERNSQQRRRADKPAPPTRRQACASPTVSIVSSNSSNGSKVSKSTFSIKQLAVINDVLAEATELLGSDAGYLTLPELVAAGLGFDDTIAYHDAFTQIAQSDNRTLARDFTRAVLGLRTDERVQGVDLDLSPTESE